MKVEIQFRDLQTSNALREHARRQLHARLRRFGRRVHNAHVRIGNINGPRGGEEMYCRVTAWGEHGAVSVRMTAVDPYEAVNLAAYRLQRAVARKLDRRRVVQRSAGRWAA